MKTPSPLHDYRGEGVRIFVQHSCEKIMKKEAMVVNKSDWYALCIRKVLDLAPLVTIKA